MAYANLKAEMARKKVTVKLIAEKLNKSTAKVSKNINGTGGDFDVMEALKIRDMFFPDLQIDYLFRSSEE